MASERTQQDLSAVDRDFAAGATVLRAPPTRLYLNLTERCSLRCQYCLTHAPERTADGTARDMSADVVEALRPHLEHVVYLGFPHAGEPLLAPQLVPVLRALQEARGDEPTVVHLLSNGLALNEDRFVELCALGVNSWSISMDGMSAATQDAFRLGSSSQKLQRSLRVIARARQGLPGRVRIGISCNVLRANLGEIGELVEFAASAGLDWVKLEELVSVNAIAAREAAIPLRELVSTLHEVVPLAARLGVPLLQHLVDVPYRACAGDDDAFARVFSARDSFANRMPIHACRLPWQLLCVEPDGEVKPVSFLQPAAGNVLQQDLREIWNSPGLQRARHEALQGRCRSVGVQGCAGDLDPRLW